MSIILKQQLDAVSERWYRLKVLKRQTLCWMLLLIPAAILAVCLPENMTPRFQLLILVGITFVGTLLARWKVSTPSAIDAARLIEKKHPEFNDTVLTAVQTSTRTDQPQSSVLERRTVAEADELARRSDWGAVISSRQLALWTLVSLLSFCVLISGVIAAQRWKPNLASAAIIDAAEKREIDVQEVAASLEVEPGDTEVQQGAAVTVVARFSGSVPVASRCRLMTDSGMTLLPLESTVDAGVFAARIPAIQRDSEYRIEFAGSVEEAERLEDGEWSGQSDTFQISTFVLPELLQVDALVRPPAYTQRPEKLIEDTLRITAVEGSMIDLSLLVNKPLAVAELRSSDGEVLPTILKTVAAQDTATSPDSLSSEAVEASIDVGGQVLEIPRETQLASCVLRAVKNDRFEVYLEDAEGRTAKEVQTIILKVTKNKRPKVKVTFPGKDTNVSALQEVLLEAEATDDFGLLDFGIQYSLSSGEMAEISLKDATDRPSEEKDSNRDQPAPVMLPTQQLLSHTVDLESLNAEPDQLLSYSFYVVDTAADGSRRTTFGDLLFAEVRRYEDIFREADQQGQQSEQQQQQQQGGASEELLKLQREIIIATWNVQRDIRDAKSSERSLENAVEDGGVIQESQQQAIDQLTEAMAEMQDVDLQQIAESVSQTMQQGKQSLTDFIADPNVEQLTKARSLQQQAFAGLMKMRAKETEIQQSQSQSSSSSSSSSSSQQQMQELELDNERQRYESERQAAEQQQQQQEQAVQVLNRLKELARRQAMMNERIKELESELRSVETEKEKEEIERELKRLQDEQRELLRDVDEVSQEMQEQSQSAQQSSQQSEQRQQESQEAQQQLQEAREQVQRTSEALQEGDLQKAISEGTRAERQFDQLQEDFRQQTSNQFSEAMQDLRQQARDLQETQEEVARELAGESASEVDGAKESRPSLKEDRDKQGIAEKIAKQKDALERILEQAEQVVKAAEESEPLLSRRLYDTLQDSQKERTFDALDATEILMDRGLWNQSQETEQLARQGIDELTEGIEQAAEAVLGSEQESLRRAEQTVQELAKELQQEIAREMGEAAGQPGLEPGSQNPDGRQSDQGSPDQSPSDQPSSDQEAEGAGERQDDQQQQGRSGGQGRPAEQEGQPAEQGQSGQGNASEGQAGEGKPSDQSSEPEQPGQQRSSDQQPRQGQPGSEGQQSSESEQSGQSQQQSNGQQPSDQQPSGQASGSSQSSLLNGGRESNGGSASRNAAPLTGEDYRSWSGRLREVEEILDDDELRNQAARVRDRARSIRAEFRRHGKEPEWDLVKSEILDDMLDLQRRIQQQLSVKQTERSLAPIDREPVPEAYNEVVRRYYELLGQARDSTENQPSKQKGAQ